MKMNLNYLIDKDLNIMSVLFTNSSDPWKQIDTHAFQKKFLDKDIILVLYPKLLSYTYVYVEGRTPYKVINENESKITENYITPWVACRIELKNDIDPNEQLNILKSIKEWVRENIPLKPFKDEDAIHGMFGIDASPYNNKITQYIMYFNPNFENGWWENHTL